MIKNLLCAGVTMMTVLQATSWSQPLVYEGRDGVGKGKHIVWLAGDHEYRSEETLPALARILSQRYGFKCTVLFTVKEDTGFIVPGHSNLPGTEALKDADLGVFFLRFLNLPAEQMQPIVDYLGRGGPVIGLRTATHAFNNIPKESPYAKYNWNYKGEDYTGGFGRQVLGETWAGHYGANHKQSTRVTLVPEQSGHSILRGVKDVWVQAGGYFTKPMPGSEVLAMAQPLTSMKQDGEPDASKPPVPGAWTRTYTSTGPGSAREFTSTYGASEDILNEGYRRMLVNACLWAVGLEDAIKADADIAFVGPYQPVTFNFEGYRKGVKPSDLQSLESPILPVSNAGK